MAPTFIQMFGADPCGVSLMKPPEVKDGEEPRLEVGAPAGSYWVSATSRVRSVDDALTPVLK